MSKAICLGPQGYSLVEPRVPLGPQGHSVVEPRGPSITQTALNMGTVDFAFREVLKDTLLFWDDEEENDSFRNHFCIFCFFHLIFRCHHCFHGQSHSSVLVF